ncbi:MAG: DMT family transporter [Gammaproteobacteria bacterium]|nr:DMT family transporter [Gammaproteobacteria bacterium]
MHIALAYLGVILIWSTTPLAIQWSSAEVGYLFGVTSRMVIGAIMAVTIVLLMGWGFYWNRRSRLAYLIAGFTVYGSMLATYWSAQYIPSGWISLLFGLSPLLTTLFSHYLITAQPLSLRRTAGILVAFCGLTLIFASGLHLSTVNHIGIYGILFAVSLHSLGAVLLKRLNSQNPALVTTSGSLGVAAPLFLLTWWFLDGQLPATIPLQSGIAILYLALFGSVIGFALYYFVLQQVDATRVSLITLITPVTALLLGHQLNHEPLTTAVIFGSILILIGLVLFEYDGYRAGRAPLLNQIKG